MACPSSPRSCGEEGVVGATARVPAGSHTVGRVLTQAPASFCREIQRLIGVHVYRNSTGDGGLGFPAAKDSHCAQRHPDDEAHVCVRIAVAQDEGQTSISRVTSTDDTPIAIECAEAGPALLIVHDVAGDHMRWAQPRRSSPQRFYHFCANHSIDRVRFRAEMSRLRSTSWILRRPLSSQAQKCKSPRCTTRKSS